ncbi:MAG: MliC family protein [Bradyrhizobium sp.]|uniref:MliC family protein n=1 Tax=Bradyrhizobium sp. TaxID=376 RepID=UPI0025BEA9A0|nr:MliC family protein [Bradyrhizobium sp.]MBI5262855.1 MliC family protein [Bradyrhizobium sp.]
MGRHKAIILAAVFMTGGTLACTLPCIAQTFQSYRCADGTRFIVGFYRSDPRAYIQIDGHEVTLGKRPTFSGVRYSGRGITLQIGKTGTTVKHLKRPATTCELS